MFDRAAGMQLITGALVLIFCSLLQLYYQPFCRSRQNWMEFISLTVAFLSMMMGLYLQYPSLSDTEKMMIRGYIISSTLGIVIWFGYLMFHESSLSTSVRDRLSSIQFPRYWKESIDVLEDNNSKKFEFDNPIFSAKSLFGSK